MPRGRIAALITAVVVIGGIVAGVILTSPPRAPQTTTLIGAVLAQNTDPRKQSPIADADVTAFSVASTGAAKSDASGAFRLTMTPAIQPGESLTLIFRHSGYETLQLTEAAAGQIYLGYMIPLATIAPAKANAPEVTIGDPRVRYSMNTTITMDIGSIAKTFEIVNTNGIRCNGHPPCSPDGKWKAAAGSASFDAGQGNKFSSTRVSCIAGPCPFTKLESEQLSHDGRILTVSALNWSDTTTFLVEAEVVQTKPTDIIRESYPVKFGETMDFALPASGEGPSIEADVNGNDIIFPLGPDLILSWASCTMKIQPDQSKLYRCELKPGYRFK